MDRKPIKGYEGLYEVAEDGRVFSLERTVIVDMPYGPKVQKVPAIERKCSSHGTGYLTIRLANNGVVKTFRVHRIVAEALYQTLKESHL